MSASRESVHGGPGIDDQVRKPFCGYVVRRDFDAARFRPRRERRSRFPSGPASRSDSNSKLRPPAHDGGLGQLEPWRVALHEIQRGQRERRRVHLASGDEGRCRPPSPRSLKASIAAPRPVPLRGYVERVDAFAFTSVGFAPCPRCCIVAIGPRGARAEFDDVELRLLRQPARE